LPTFAFKALVAIVDGATLARVAKPGNPLTVLVTTTLPLPTKILTLYVRLGRVGEFELKVIEGSAAIQAYFTQVAGLGGTATRHATFLRPGAERWQPSGGLSSRGAANGTCSSSGASEPLST
jgi:hypothetical protein